MAEEKQEKQAKQPSLYDTLSQPKYGMDTNMLGHHLLAQYAAEDEMARRRALMQDYQGIADYAMGQSGAAGIDPIVGMRLLDQISRYRRQNELGPNQIDQAQYQALLTGPYMRNPQSPTLQSLISGQTNR